MRSGKSLSMLTMVSLEVCTYLWAPVGGWVFEKNNLFLICLEP